MLRPSTADDPDSNYVTVVEIMRKYLCGSNVAESEQAKGEKEEWKNGRIALGTLNSLQCFSHRQSRRNGGANSLAVSFPLASLGLGQRNGCGRRYSLTDQHDEVSVWSGRHLQAGPHSSSARRPAGPSPEGIFMHRRTLPSDRRSAA